VGPSWAPTTLSRSQAIAPCATKPGLEEEPLGFTLAQTVLVSWECCHVAPDVLAVDHDPQPQVPLRDLQLVLEAGDVGGQRLPLATLGRELLEGQPAPVADFDGVGAPPRGQQAQHVALEKRGVHAEFQGSARPSRAWTAAMIPRSKVVAWLESWTLPGRFLRRRIWPVWAT
jgi:hypothetical protein